MLVLTRRAGESIVIGDDVRVVVLDSAARRCGSASRRRAASRSTAPRSTRRCRRRTPPRSRPATSARWPTGSPGAARPRCAPGRPVRRGRVSGCRARTQARRMVTMTEGDQRLEQVHERIDEARDAAEHAEPDLLPQASAAPPTARSSRPATTVRPARTPPRAPTGTHPATSSTTTDPPPPVRPPSRSAAGAVVVLPGPWPSRSPCTRPAVRTRALGPSGARAAAWTRWPIGPSG